MSTYFGAKPVAIGAVSLPSQTEWRMTITGSAESHCHSPLMRGAVLAAVNTLLPQPCLVGCMANVGPTDPSVGMEVELRMNAVDQLASGYNSSQSAALLVGV